MSVRRALFQLVLLAVATASVAFADDPKPLPSPKAPNKTLPEAVQPTPPKPSTPVETVTPPPVTPGAPVVVRTIPKPPEPLMVKPNNGSPTVTPVPNIPPSAPSEQSIVLYFDYGSEKQKWIEGAVTSFNAEKKRTNGKIIKVVPRAAGSGELIDRLLSEKTASSERPPAHLVSPASPAFLSIGNASSNEANLGDLTGPPTPLVRSPIVLALWREQAEAIGWGKKPIHWREIFDYARQPDVWKAAAGNDASPFKLGQTDPTSSNSGLHALFLQAYAFKGSYESAPTRVDVANNAELAKFVREVQAAVPGYPSSTGFLMKEMLKNGPKEITGAIVYENLVVDANADGAGKPPRIVAIYPVDGSFSSEHPIAIVKRDWVTPEHQQAATAFIEFLTSPPLQKDAGRFGFRPADASAAPGDRIQPEFGVQPAPIKELELPPASVIRSLLDLWSKEKNPNAAPPRSN